MALLVGSGAAAAAPGGAPENAQNDDQRGPPVDLPDPVPDFVGDVHEAIRGFLSGTVENLGEAVSDLTPGGAEGDAAGTTYT